MGFFKLEPFGPLRDAQYAATIAQTLVNMHLGKDGDPYELEHFFPELEAIKSAEPEPDPDMVWEKACRIFGGVK